MNSGHQVHQQQRIGRAEPQRGDLRYSASAGQPRRRPDDQADSDQHHHAVRQHRCDDVLPGEPGNAPPDPQEQRAVRGWSLPPKAGYRRCEHMVQPQPRCRADPVGIEAVAGDLTLRQIGIDVLAVHRRGEEQRQHPQQQRAVELAARHPPRAVYESAQHQPGQRHHHRTGGGHGQRDGLDPGRQVQQAHTEGGVLDDGAGTGAEGADRHQDRSGRTEQPGAVHGPQFDPVEGRAHGPFIAVPARDGQAEGVPAGCHHRTLSGCDAGGSAGEDPSEGALARPV